VTREMYPRDRRYSIIRATRKGKQSAGELAHVFGSIQTELFLGLEESDVYHKTTITGITLETSAAAKARLAVKEENQELLFVTNGQTTWIYSLSRKEYIQVRAAAHSGDQPGSNQGSETNPFSQYQILLVNRFRSLSMYATTAVMEKEATIKVAP
jgi:hypothetical protein